MDPYSLLGIDRGASPSEIKSAYKKGVKKYHPDIDGSDEAATKFQEISDAYESLTSPSKTHPDSPFGYDSRFNQSFEDIFKNFNREFSDYKPRPANLSAMYRITLAEAYTGVDADLTYHLPDGTRKTVKFKIPAGIHRGEQIICGGYGQTSAGGKSDLIVTIDVAEPGKFRRVHDDIVIDETVDVVTAMAGGTLDIDTISGSKVRVTIPPGTQPNSKMRVTGAGMPRNGSYGSMIIILHITIPAISNDDKTVINEVLHSAK